MQSTKAQMGDMKHFMSLVDADDLPHKRAKRTKTAKACFTCRHQKTRCEPGTPTVDGLSQCARCISFNIECSFRQSPPPISTPVVSDATHSAASSWNVPTMPSQHGSDPHSFPPSFANPGHRQSSAGESSHSQADSAAVRSHTTGEWQVREASYPMTPTSPPLGLGAQTRTSLELATTSNTSWHQNANANAEQWAAPISFASELMEATTPKKESKRAVGPADDLVAQGIVSPGDAEELSRIWATRYSPWHPIEMTNDRHPNAAPSSYGHEPITSSFLQAAKWSLAARHLPLVAEGSSSRTSAASNSELRRRISRVLDHRLSRVMLGLDRSLPALRALIVLATWASTLASPWDEAEANIDAEALRVYNGELLLCTAAHLASQMHLEADVETAFAQKSADGKWKENPSGASQRTLDRARVMFAVSVANVLMNLGKGRLCSTRVPLRYAEHIFGSPSALAIRQGPLGDAHLVFQCNLLVIILRMANRSTTTDILRSIGPDEWTKRITDDLQELDYLQQSLVTTSVLVGQDHMTTMTSIIMVGHFLKLNSIFRAFRTLYRAYPDSRGTHDILQDIRQDAKQYENPFTFQSNKEDPEDDRPSYPKSWDSVVPKGFISSYRPMTHEWGHRTKETTESFMTASLGLYSQGPDPNALAPLIYAPDYICGAIVFCASYSVKMHLMGLLLFKRVPETTELNRSVIVRLIHMFCQASPGSLAPFLAEVGGAPSASSVPNSPIPSNAFAAPNVMAECCVHALTALVKLWDARIRELGDTTEAEGLDDVPSSPPHIDSETAVEVSPCGTSSTIPVTCSNSDIPQQENPAIVTPHSAGDTDPSQPHASYPHVTTAQRHGASSEITPIEPLADFIASFTGYSQPGDIPGAQGDMPELPSNLDFALFHDPMLALDSLGLLEPSLQWLSKGDGGVRTSGPLW